MAAAAGPGAGPAVAGNLILKLPDRGPTLPINADAKGIVIYRLELRTAANELGIGPYVYGPAVPGELRGCPTRRSTRLVV